MHSVFSDACTVPPSSVLYSVPGPVYHLCREAVEYKGMEVGHKRCANGELRDRMHDARERHGEAMLAR